VAEPNVTISCEIHSVSVYTGQTPCCWSESLLLWCAEVWRVPIKTLLQDKDHFLQTGV